MNNELIELTYVCKVCEASFSSDAYFQMSTNLLIALTPFSVE